MSDVTPLDIVLSGLWANVAYVVFVMVPCLAIVWWAMLAQEKADREPPPRGRL